MNLLLCGSNSAFQKKLIKKLQKENHEIFVMTGKNNSEEVKLKGVFQQYNFDFTSERVGNVLENIKPDMVIFMGAGDENHVEDFEQIESFRYISGLVSIVTASKSAGVKKFAYISSLGVFEGNKEEVIQEQAKPIPISEKNKSYLQGEQLCEFYHEANVFEVVTVRVPEIYGVFGRDYEKNNIIEKFIKEGIREKSITVYNNRPHLLIELNDGVEACYDILFKMGQSEQNIYCVPGTTYLESEIASLILENLDDLDDLIEIKEVESQTIGNLVLQQGSLEKSGFILRRRLEESLYEICKVIKEEKISDVKIKKRETNKTKWFFTLLENVVLFVVAYFLTLFTDNTEVGNIVNFYLIYVVLIAVTHGMAQTLLAAVLSIIGNISFLLSKDGLQGFVGNYDIYLWVLQLLVIGALVAYMRDKYKGSLRDVSEDNKYLKEELEEINEINDSNVYIKDIYEKRLVSYKNSLSRLYEVTTALDYLEPQKVIFQAATVISKLMDCNNIAVYIGNGKSKYYRLAAATSVTAKQLGKSFALEEKSDIFEDLLGKDIYRNRNLIEKMPTMAGATYKDNMITAVIMVWSENLENSTIYQVNMLSILCRLIERSTLRAYDFMEALADESYYENSNLMKTEAFLKILDIYKEGEEQGLLEYTVLNLILKDNRDNEVELASKLIRDTDYIGVVDKNVKILLSSTSEEETDSVIKRFNENKLNVKLGS